MKETLIIDLRLTVVETRLYETIFDVHMLLGFKLGIQ
jgi:hypothetical protein